jgi:hypothetical protein
MVLTSLAANVRAATHPDTKHMATIRIFFTILAAAVLVVGFRFPTATKSLDDHFAKRQESAFMELLNDPFHLSAAVLLIAIGVYHLTLSSRVLIGRCTQPSPSVHLILLFAGPSLVAMLVLAALPTTIPGLFIIPAYLDRFLRSRSWNSW